MHKDRLTGTALNMNFITDIVNSLTTNLIPKPEDMLSTVPKPEDLIKLIPKPEEFLSSISRPKPKPTPYKDDWKICPNCGEYYVYNSHSCVALKRRFSK